MELIRNNKPAAAVAAVIGAAVVAWLAFGFFGIQAAFIDDQVNETNPFAVQAGSAADDSSADRDGEQADADDTNNDEAANGADADGAATAGGPASEPLVESSGSFIGLEHAAVGQATILSDGDRRFLRFEDFETDNGPDLFVYLVAGASAEGDKDLFDDDFVNLGRLAGNVGDQNYEVDIDLDLDRYNTVVIWCDRFNASFAAADLS